MPLRYIVWAILGCLTTAAGVYDLCRPENAATVAGGWVCLGLLFVTALLIGTLLDEIAARRRERPKPNERRGPRGFDVIVRGRREEQGRKSDEIDDDRGSR